MSEDAGDLMRRGVRRMRTGQIDAAIGDLQRAVDLDPERRRSLVLLGLAHQRRGEDELAQAAFEEAGLAPTEEDRAATQATPRVTEAGGLPVVDLSRRSLTLLSGGLMLAPAGVGTCTRLRLPVAMSGDLQFQVAGRRRKGHPTDEAFEGEGGPLCELVGDGAILLAPVGGRFTRLEVDGSCFLIEDRIEAIDGTLAFENGRLPGRGVHLNTVRLRGKGGVVIHTRGNPFGFPVGAERRVQVLSDRLIGWFGEVLPLLHPGDAEQMPTLMCSGEGMLVL